jgi:glutathione S-transferase
VIRVLRIPFSTNVERVALALGHKGLAAEWVDVDPADRTPVRDLSGQELVPVAVFGDGTVIHDSTEIVEAIERRHPEDPLYPADVPRAAEVRIFVDWFNRVWKRPPNALVDLAEDDPQHAGLVRELRDSRERFESLLTGRDYLFGDFTAADLSAFPFLKYALGANPADEDPFHAILVDNLALDGAYPRLEEWIGRVDEHPRA